MKLKIANPIRWIAVLCVAITSAYVMVMSYRLLQTLSGPGWCRTALGAEQASSTDGTIKGLDACVSLLTIQLKALANNSYIFGGVIALCLATLIVIVIAGGFVTFNVSKSGASGTIGREPATPAEKAAIEVADAAVDKAKEVVADGTVGTNGEDG